MPAITTRTFAAVPPEVADVLRPVLPDLADETIAAIAVEVPDYARAMEGEFGQVVRVGVEVAFNRFVDLVLDEAADAPSARQTYVDLGRGEFRAGRSLDALLAAYRVGARLAWRRFVEAGTGADLPADVLYAVGEAIFAYIDELSAESVEGYTDEQSAAAGESQRRRRRLVGLLARDTAPTPEALRTAALAAGWTLPRRIAALVTGGGEGSEEAADASAARLARRLGAGAIGGAAGGLACVFVPDPDAPGRKRQLESALGSDARGRRPRAENAPGADRGPRAENASWAATARPRAETAVESVAAIGPLRSARAVGGRACGGPPRPTGSAPPGGCQPTG